MKIQENKLSSRQKEELKMMFVEAKWIKNAILQWSRENPEKRISEYDTKKKTVVHKDKDMNNVIVELKYLPAKIKSAYRKR